MLQIKFKNHKIAAHIKVQILKIVKILELIRIIMAIILWKSSLDLALDNLKIISKIVIRLIRKNFKKFHKIKTKFKTKI
jgi:hypothetical protein